jgi:hypothetical protein
MTLVAGSNMVVAARCHALVMGIDRSKTITGKIGEKEEHDRQKRKV